MDKTFAIIILLCCVGVAILSFKLGAILSTDVIYNHRILNCVDIDLTRVRTTSK